MALNYRQGNWKMTRNPLRGLLHLFQKGSSCKQKRVWFEWRQTFKWNMFSYEWFRTKTFKYRGNRHLSTVCSSETVRSTEMNSSNKTTGHFTEASEAGGDLASIQTSLLFHLNANLLALEQLDLHNKSSEVFIETRSPAASLSFKGQGSVSRKSWNFSGPQGSF